MTKDLKHTIQIWTFIIFIGFIAFYAFFVSKDLVVGVQIKDVNIEDGLTVNENILNITGNAKNSVELLLDGREISIDQSGNFNETIALLPGYNVVNIKAKDSFGNQDEKTYKLIFE